MLTSYIQSAMKRAKYEILTDGTFYAEIPDLPGVWANTSTLEDCRLELQEVLEGWADISGDLLARILRQANIDRDEWEKL